MSNEHTNGTHEPHHDGEAGYEKRDVNIARLLLVTVVSVIVVVASIVIMMEYFVHETERAVYEAVLAPESNALRELRAREDRELHSYAVVDTATATYRIPIDRAMKLVADEAFQNRMDETKK